MALFQPSPSPMETHSRDLVCFDSALHSEFSITTRDWNRHVRLHVFPRIPGTFHAISSRLSFIDLVFSGRFDPRLGEIGKLRFMRLLPAAEPAKSEGHGATCEKDKSGRRFGNDSEERNRCATAAWDRLESRGERIVEVADLELVSTLID
jgi:hypothetical protein